MSDTVIRPVFGRRKQETATATALDAESPDVSLSKEELVLVEKVRVAVGSIIDIVAQVELQVGCMRAKCDIPEYSDLKASSETYRSFCLEAEAAFDQVSSPLARIGKHLHNFLGEIAYHKK